MEFDRGYNFKVMEFGSKRNKVQNLQVLEYRGKCMVVSFQDANFSSVI